MVYRKPKAFSGRRQLSRRGLAERHVRRRLTVPRAPAVPRIAPMHPRYFRGALRPRVPLRTMIRRGRSRLRPARHGLTYAQSALMRRILSRRMGKVAGKQLSKGW